MRVLSGLLVLSMASCSSSSSPPQSIRTGPVESAHTHERDKMMIADAGSVHAALTAHLSRDGNELDLFLETPGRSPEPVTITAASLSATIKVNDEPEQRVVTFAPAPAEERPEGETGAACSHFVAKAAWMKRSDRLTVECELEIDGEKHKVIWKDFRPVKYAHHDDSMTERPAP